MHEGSLDGRHVVFLSWRDTATPEGGGAERYLEKMAEGLVEHGCTVTIFCAAHAAAPPEETRGGIRFVRRGTKLSVYAAGMRALRRGDLDGPQGRTDLVVDVQNGLPFFSRMVTDAPVIVLIHHVHREQWPVVYPGLSGRIGWWIERRFAPRLYRREQYVAVSRATRDELVALGIDQDRIAVVHNGTDPYRAVDPGKSPELETPTDHPSSAPSTPWWHCRPSCQGCVCTWSGPAGGRPSWRRTSRRWGRATASSSRVT